MLDFAALPPEVNSALMYAGPGSSPMLAAATAWNTIAAEMRSAAIGYGSAVSELTGESWLGPSSASMAAATAPYLAWLNTTATAAEQASTQASAASAAYESAFAMTVPPTVIATNRAQLSHLLSTNLFGQNAAAVAATESRYSEMWAQDAAAMNGYAAASSAATQLAPLTAPRTSTGTGAAATQAAAVSQATTGSTTASTAASTSSSGLASWLGMAPNSDTATTGLAGLLNDLDGANGSVVGSFLNNATVSNFSNGFTTSGLWNPSAMMDSVTSFSFLFEALAMTGGATPPPFLAGLSSAGTLGAAGLPGLAASAGMGQASLVGALSAPPSWAAAGAAISPIAATSRLGAGAYHGLLGATPMVMEDVGPAGLPGIPVGAMADNSEEEAPPLYGFRPTVMARPPAAG